MTPDEHRPYRGIGGPLFLLLWAVLVLSPAEAREPESVLVLHSYHAELPWTRGLMRGIRAGLGERPDLELHVEYLDQIRHRPAEVFPAMEVLLRSKFASRPPDLVLATDDPALDFLLERRSTLFPGVPLVFCGINRYEPERLAEAGPITGIVEWLDLRETLRMARRLQPEIRRMAVVSDGSEVSGYRLRALEAIAGEFPDIEFVRTTRRSLDALLDEIRILPRDGTALLYLLFVRDDAGRSYPSGIRVLNRIAEAVPFPIYTYKQIDVGNGALGGMVIDEEVMARHAAEMAARVLDGVPAEQIPVLTRTPAMPVFDDRLLKRHGISADLLPPDARLRNRPDGFRHRHPGIFRGMAALLGILSLLLAGLVVSNRRRERISESLRRSRAALEAEIGQRARELDRINRELRREIAERRQTEAALIESEAKFRTIFHLSPQPVALAEPETGRILDANERLCRLTGYGRKELVGRTSVEIGLLTREQRDHFYRELSQAGQVEGMEMTFRIRDGSQRNLLMFSRLVTLAERPAILSILVDVTRRNLLEQQMNRHRRMEAVSTLAGGIAHQFNNALYGIVGNVDLLLMKYPGDPVLERHLRTMKEVSDRMTRLTNQLLAYARGGKFNVEKVRAGEILEDTLAILTHEIPRNIRLETRLNVGDAGLEIDIPQFQMVLSAVLANAMEAMPDGGSLRIEAEPASIDAAAAASNPDAEPGEYLRIDVTDDGRGMGEDIRARIFEPFFTTHFQGRGLGMAAVYGIVRNHGGWVAVESEVGRGTRVHFFFPRKAVSAPPVATRDESTGNGTILVVEDEPSVMAVTEEMLHHLGYRVLKAETGRSALETARDAADPIDLVILDIVLPDATGQEIFRRLRAERPELRVLLASGYAEDGPARAILQNGANGFIQKPYTLRSLRGKLAEVLAN